MASEPVLSPFTSQDFNECEEIKNWILDFAYRCRVRRVDPMTKMVMTALGFTPDSNTGDLKESTRRVLSKLPSLSSHVLKSKSREYDIPQRTTRQYEVEIGVQVPANLGAGPQAATWTLGTSVDGTATYNDTFFVRDYAVGYLYNTLDPVNTVQEMVLIVGKDTVAGTIDVIRNHDSAGRPMPIWLVGTKIYLGENAIPEILPDCQISCETILSPCCDKGYIQGFKHCQSITKEWLNKPVQAVFSNKSQEAYRQMMDQFIDELTNSLWGSHPSKFVDGNSSTVNYTMAGQAHWRQYYTQLIIDDCCAATFDEAMLSLSEEAPSPDFNNTDIYIGFASKQAMRYLRNLGRNNQTIFRPISDYKGIKPEVWEIAMTLGLEQVLAYAGDGYNVLFLESDRMTRYHPFQIDLINYGTWYLTTIPEITENFQGISSRYGGFMRRVDPNTNAAIDSSFCPISVGYEGFLGMEQFCAASNATLSIVNCDSCTNEVVLGPSEEFPETAEEDSGAVDLEGEEESGQN
jgi:hypothetical protein